MNPLLWVADKVATAVYGTWITYCVARAAWRSTELGMPSPLPEGYGDNWNKGAPE